MSQRIFHRYPKIKILGDEENKGILDGEVVIEEKIDGGNFRFMLQDGKILFGSRNQNAGYEDDQIDKTFLRAVDFIKSRIRREYLEEVDNTFGGLIVYGEYCAKHTVSYDWTSIPPYLVYDAYSLGQERFLNYEEKAWLFSGLNLPSVPLVRKGKVGEGITLDDVKTIPKSAYRDGSAEGIVIKNYPKQVFAKVVADEFKEKFGVKREKRDRFEDDTGRLVEAYCTDARVQKIILKLLETGEKLGMELMRKLPIAVTSDIWEEEWRELSISNYKIDMKRFRSLIAGVCLRVLRQMMVDKVKEETTQ